MINISDVAIESVNKSRISFCKFISPNDAGKTGAHQSGYYIPKNAVPLMFDEPGIKGEIKKRCITIKWQNDFETESKFIYYGQGTRNEYRLTTFGRGFPFLSDDNVGDLLILCQFDYDSYEGFVLRTEEDIEEFFAAFNFSSAETNALIDKTNLVSAEEKLLQCFRKYLSITKTTFPSSLELATNARKCFNNSYSITDAIVKSDPDHNLLNWLEAEYQLFKVFENDRYKERIETPFKTVEELINIANTILNRRKSRAGKSLEHHLSEVFNKFSLKFETQVITEENKKPDFIFPDAVSYKKENYNSGKLVFLASKTTCKDRWRQILNEADRIEVKHLFTLQQGISINQLSEMYKYNVQLVVPRQYISTFPSTYRDRILTLGEFIEYVKSKQ
jgi:type II restriction enzyme